MQTEAQFSMRGKDIYQLRDHLYNFARYWMLKAGTTKKATEEQLSRMMEYVDRLIYDPGMDAIERSRFQYVARHLLDEVVAFHAGTDRQGKPLHMGDDKLRDTIMSQFDSILKEISKRGPAVPEDAWYVDVVKTIKKHVAEHDKVEPGLRKTQGNMYEFFVDTGDGEFPVGNFEIETPLQAQMILDRVRHLVAEFQSIKGDASPEAKSQRLRLLTSNPFEVVPTRPSGAPSTHGYQAHFSKAQQIIGGAAADLKRIWAKMRQEVARLRSASHVVDISLLSSLFNQLVLDLTQSSMGMTTGALGSGAIDLSQFAQRSWRVAQVAQPAAHVSDGMRALLQEAVAVLEKMNNDLATTVHDVRGKQAATSWRRVAQSSPAVMAPPPEKAAPASMPAPAAAPAPAAKPQAPQQAKPPAGPAENPAFRVLKWELALAMGAANRGIKQMKEVLGDQTFWSQFEPQQGTWEPSWRKVSPGQPSAQAPAAEPVQPDFGQPGPAQ